MADAMVLKRRLEDERSLLSLLEGISAEGYVLNTWLYYIEAYSRLSRFPSRTSYCVPQCSITPVTAKHTTRESCRFITPRDHAWLRLRMAPLREA